MKRTSQFVIMSLILAACAGKEMLRPVPPPSASSVEAAAPEAFASTAKAADSEAYLHYAISQLAAHAGGLDEAISELRKALALDPELTGALVHLARWLAKKETHVEAVEGSSARRPTRSDSHCLPPCPGRDLPSAAPV